MVRGPAVMLVKQVFGVFFAALLVAHAGAPCNQMDDRSCPVFVEPPLV